MAGRDKSRLMDKLISQGWQAAPGQGEYFVRATPELLAQMESALREVVNGGLHVYDARDLGYDIFPTTRPV